MVYYLALCFMRSSGVLYPRDHRGNLDNALTNLVGTRPGRSVQTYSAIHLHKLVREITQEFKEVRLSLIRNVKRHLGELDFTPRAEFQERECTFTF